MANILHQDRFSFSSCLVSSVCYLSSSMDSDTLQLLLGAIAFEFVQILLIWIYIRRRYQVALKELNRLTAQLATGERPSTYYIAGASQVEELTRNLEAVGARLEQFHRQQGAEDFNLNILLANMVEGVMVVDRAHIIRLANAELVRLFDLKQSPVERTVLEALREARVELVLRQAMASGSALQQEVELDSGGRAENVRHFQISVVPIRNRDGEVDGAVVVFHNITRIKQLEVMRREFVANVSHELRTPLAIFRGYLETLLDNPGLSRDDTQPMIEALARNSKRLAMLVEDLLMLTHIESAQSLPEYTLVRLGLLLRQIVQDWNNRAGSEPAQIDCVVPDDLPSVEVDAVRF